MSDEPEQLTVTRFAQKFRLEAAAALVQIIRDESASPNARANAAEKLINYSDGRPGAPRPIMVEDLKGMTDAARMSLLKALGTFYTPTEFKTLIGEAVDAAMEAERERPPPPVKMVRRAPVIPPPRPEAEILPPEPPPTPQPLPPNVIHPSVLERSRLQAFQASDPTFRDYKFPWYR
jgi:hypothetical protein